MLSFILKQKTPVNGKKYTHLSFSITFLSTNLLGYGESYYDVD